MRRNHGSIRFGQGRLRGNSAFGVQHAASESVVVHRGMTAVGPHGGVYHRGGTWAGHPYGGYGYHAGYYHGGYGYGGYGYRPYYGYGAAAAVGAAALGAAVVAPHCGSTATATGSAIKGARPTRAGAAPHIDEMTDASCDGDAKAAIVCAKE